MSNEANTTQKSNPKESIIQRKKMLAERNDTIISIVNGPETRALIDMIHTIDLAAVRLKNRMITSKKEKSEEIQQFLMNDYKEMIKNLDAFAKKIAVMADLKYKTNKIVKNIISDGQEGDDEKIEI